MGYIDAENSTLGTRINYNRDLTRRAQGFRFDVPDSRFEVPDTRFEVPDCRVEVPDSESEDPVTRFEILTF